MNSLMPIFRLTLVILVVTTCCSAFIPAIYGASIKREGHQTASAYQGLLPKDRHRSGSKEYHHQQRQTNEAPPAPAAAGGGRIMMSIEGGERLLHSDNLVFKKNHHNNNNKPTRKPEAQHPLVTEKKQSSVATNNNAPNFDATLTVATAPVSASRRKGAVLHLNTKRSSGFGKLPLGNSTRALRLHSVCSKNLVSVGNGQHNIRATKNQDSNNIKLIRYSLEATDKNHTIVAIKGAETNRFICFNKKGELISKKLNKKIVPPNCQFKEHRKGGKTNVRYSNVGSPDRLLGFHSNGHPYSYCRSNGDQSKCRGKTHRERKHRKCSFFKPLFEPEQQTAHPSSVIRPLFDALFHSSQNSSA